MSKKIFTNTIEDVRRGCKKDLSGFLNGRYAVVSYTQYKKNRFNYGIQFWTPEEIAAGEAVNPDGLTKSFFAEYL